MCAMITKEEVLFRLPKDKKVALFIKQLEREAAEQFISAMEQPFVVRGTLMPDAHAGYSLPIGAVVATEHIVVPSWVGYDQGCGVYGIKTSIVREEIQPYIDKIFSNIYDRIPVGHKHREYPISWNEYKKIAKTPEFEQMFEEKGGLYQLGTLGGGNHMAEIAYDEDSYVWIVIHSGSRNVGHSMATHYMRLASPDNKVREKHYGLSVDSKEGKNYLMDMEVCLRFALKNREVIANEILAILSNYVPKFDTSIVINRNHNHCESKQINGRKVWIHRKGATQAEYNMYGIIPGNMRDGSFVVRGLGNEESLFSSSHGAGRVMSRKKAKESIDMEDFRTAMKDIKAKVASSTIDESPMAYKNIFEVIEMQKDLVEIIAYLKPIINVKG